ncbi:hypothetical protein KEM52_006497 [Ascosphaera acerosa]|nr:hypothetical protein KEM52_006497 [Ascosphaera acerosa]
MILGQLPARLAIIAIGLSTCSQCLPHSLKNKTTAAAAAAASPDVREWTGRPLEWGQLNFLHTTDLHGFLSGHRHSPYFKADWGDFAAFVSRMRAKAVGYGVDLLLVDTGDVHDGAGLSDATAPNGRVTNEMMTLVDYDLLTVGNHDLMSDEVARETQAFARRWHGKYIATNVQLRGIDGSGQLEDIGARYRYFTTSQGLRIMAFGLYADRYTYQSSIVHIAAARNLVRTDWWANHTNNFDKPIDMFVILTHQPFAPAPDIPVPSIWQVVADIRGRCPDTPVQVFGAHTHRRDFVVFDAMATGIESGAFAETLGWVAVNGLRQSQGTNATSPSYRAATSVSDAPQPTKTAVPAVRALSRVGPESGLRYARRYLDWNVSTLERHAGVGAVSGEAEHTRRQISQAIRQTREDLRLDQVLGCAPQDYFLDRVKPSSADSVFTLWQEAVANVVLNPDPARANRTRVILTNGVGGVSADIAKGRFTRDDSYIAYSGPAQRFYYLPDLHLSQVQALQNWTATVAGRESAASLPAHKLHHQRVKRDPQLHRTRDQFGDDGDDTPHDETGPQYPPPLVLATVAPPGSPGADLARSLEPLIYYSEDGIAQISYLQSTELAVWDLGESMRYANMTSAQLISQELDDLSANMKELGNELRRFFAMIDSGIIEVLGTMEWAKRSLEMLSGQPSPENSVVVWVVDWMHSCLGRIARLETVNANLLEESLENLGRDTSPELNYRRWALPMQSLAPRPTAFGAFTQLIFGFTWEQKTRKVLTHTFAELLGSLEEIITSELEQSTTLFSLFEAIDEHFMRLSRHINRETDNQEGSQDELLSGLWARVLGPNKAVLRRYERNVKLLSNLRNRTVANKGLLMGCRGKLMAIKVDLEQLRKRLVKPLVRPEAFKRLFEHHGKAVAVEVVSDESGQDDQDSSIEDEERGSPVADSASETSNLMSTFSVSPGEGNIAALTEPLSGLVARRIETLEATREYLFELRQRQKQRYMQSTYVGHDNYIGHGAGHGHTVIDED